MATLHRLAPLAAAVLLSLLAPGTVLTGGTAAQAADNTRYVSISGSNANPCTLAKPCRSLQYAISVVPAGGEIQVLDSGLYGNNATINKSLTISGNGNTVYLGTNININKANAVVALRGLVLDGQGTIQDGIVISAADAVHIEHCVVHGFTRNGIFLNGGTALFVTDSIARDNGFAGFSASGGRTTVTRSTAANNGHGYLVGTNGELTLESSTAQGNGGVGLSVGSGTTARISNSVITGNATGINNGFTSGTTVLTRQNNTVSGNGTDVNGTLTPLEGL